MKQAEKIKNTWLVTPEMQGLRADQYLKRYIGRISRNVVQRIIASRDFLLNDMVIKPSVRVKAGQQASLLRYAPDEKTDINQFKVSIIFEDEDILVVNKPPGLSIHPSANCLYKTLTYWLRFNFPHQKINPCHRIDKETSGLLVCAKNRAAESALKKSFFHGRVKKSYMAIVQGMMEKPITIDTPLGLQNEKGLVAIRMIADKNGKAARTKIRPLFVSASLQRTLVLCMPLTGRQHQIRAHLSMAGFAIVGDKLYKYGDEFFDGLSKGRLELLKNLEHPRHALHAARLRFTLKGRHYSFKCSLPSDFFELMADLPS